MDYKELKKKECLFEIINDFADGMDIYRHNGSLWLINTEETKWMIEFTKDKTLWYNYNLFKNLFKAISLDVSENQKYITEWFESRFLNVYTVKTTVDPFFDQDQYVEETIQNGVKDTESVVFPLKFRVEDTIQNGVKETTPSGYLGSIEMKGKVVHQIESPKQNNEVEDTIQNGVKHTHMPLWLHCFLVEDTIQYGVKINGTYVGGKRQKENVEVVIDYGVKQTYEDVYHHKGRIGGMIRNGVKESKPMDEWVNSEKIVDKTIQNGVKHTEDGDWLDGDERIEDIIQEGVKETIPTLRRTLLGVDDIVQNGVKETHEDVYHHKGRVGGVIRNGVKEVQPLPAQDGNMDWGNYYHGKEDRTKPFNAYLNDTIKYGKKL